MSSVEEAYKAKLDKLNNDRICLFMPPKNIGDDDVITQDYEKVYIYIDEYCYNQYKRLNETFEWECDEDDDIFPAFEREIVFIYGLILINNNKYAFNAFMALLLSPEWELSFRYNDKAPQHLIHELCYLFDTFMKKDVVEIGYGNYMKMILYRLMESIDKNIPNITFEYATLKEYLNDYDDWNAYFKTIKDKKTPKMKRIKELSLEERNELVTYGFIKTISSDESNADVKKLIFEYTKNRNWTTDELNKLTMDELKILCKGYGLWDNDISIFHDKKRELMKRLKDPEHAIFILKQDYHFLTIMNGQFAEERYFYNIITSKIEERKEYYDELIGIDL